MFKQSSFENEIYQSMEKQLVSNQVENKHGSKKIEKAAEYLSAAAEIFEQAGMTNESDETVKVLHSLAMENFSISDLAGFNEKDLNNLLEMSTPNQLLQVAKKISNVTEGKSSISEEIKSALKERDLSDPKVRKGLIDKFKTALKLVKVLA